MANTPSSDNPLSILMVSRSMPGHLSGGLEFHTEDLAVGLAQLGHRVDLLTTPLPESEKQRYAENNIRVFELHGVPAGRYSLGYFRGIGQAIDDRLSEGSYDVVHGQEFGWGLWKGPAQNAACSPALVLSVHGTITTETPLHPVVWRELNLVGKLGALKRFGRRFAFAPAWGRSLKLADQILVDSEFTKTELHRIKPEVGDRVRKIALGTPMERAEVLDRQKARAALGWDRSEDVQLFTLGRLEWQKGHEIVIRGLARVTDARWHYTIAGSGPELERLKEIATECGLEDRITFAGRVSDDEKLRMLAGADLFVWPERTHPAFGLVGLEAMLQNTPVMGTDRGAIPELIETGLGRDPWIVPGTKPELWTAALGSVVARPDMLRDARKGLRERVQEAFSYDRMVHGTAAAYREAIQGKSRRKP